MEPNDLPERDPEPPDDTWERDRQRERDFYARADYEYERAGDR